MQKTTLLTAVAATTSAPTTSAHGVSIAALMYTPPGVVRADEGVLEIWSTAGSGALSVTLRLYGYDADADKWFSLGTGTETGKGVLNEGQSIEGTGSIRHSESVRGLRAFSRIALQVTGISGTLCAVSAQVRATA